MEKLAELLVNVTHTEPDKQLENKRVKNGGYIKIPDVWYFSVKKNFRTYTNLLKILTSGIFKQYSPPFLNFWTSGIF